jgi:hypothetical protein
MNKTNFSDVSLNCCDCNESFTFSAGEQAFYRNAPRGWGINSQMKLSQTTNVQAINNIGVVNPAVEV